MRRALAILLALWVGYLIGNPKPCWAEWVFQLNTGSAYNFKTPLLIEQDGEDDIKVNAEYKTRAWSTAAPYYNIRVGKWFDDWALELETLHHKLYLQNKPSEVERFQISHGYNLNTVNFAFEKYHFIYRIGAGFVMTHPETKVRGKSHEDEGGFNGFYLSGVTGQLAIERRFDIYKNWFFSLEAKLTGSYAVIPIEDGEATVPNVAIHGLFGIGYRF